MGWNVLKVVWGRSGELLRADVDGLLVNRDEFDVDASSRRTRSIGRVHPRALLRW